MQLVVFTWRPSDNVYALLQISDGLSGLGAAHQQSVAQGGIRQVAPHAADVVVGLLRQIPGRLQDQRNGRARPALRGRRFPRRRCTAQVVFVSSSVPYRPEDCLEILYLNTESTVLIAVGPHSKTLLPLS